jgi:glucokinase
MHFPFPLIVCDIGGTNTRFALVEEVNRPLIMGLHAKTADFSGLEAASELAIAQFGIRPRSMMVCAAGPVRGQQVKLTNAHWFLDGPKLLSALKLEQGMLFNDFEAQALCLPVLRPDWLQAIGAPYGETTGVQLILGPGSGLGTGALLQIDGRYFPMTSEAGHVDFGPVNDEEALLFPHIDRSERGRIVAETILSGPGLLRLHRARLAVKAVNVPDCDAAHLLAKALADRLGEEAATLRLFWQIMARFAGDLALAFMATGVTFSGGVLPRLTNFLDVQSFRARFEAKIPYDHLMRSIPTRLIVSEDAVLHGLASVAASPEKYVLDYVHRAWTQNP